MKRFSYLLVCLFFLSSCAAWKMVLISNGEDKEAIQNAINDFLNTSPLSKNDSVFSVSLKHLDENVLGVSIYGYVNKLLIAQDSSTFDYSGLPTKYIEQDGNLFYWDDSSISVTSDLINTLERYDLIDTMILNVYIPEMIIDDAKKGVDYYFCKKNLLKYKKIKTNKALGHYKPPKLDCGE